MSLPCAVCESFCIVPSTGTHHRLGDARAALQQAREVPTYGTYHTYHNTTISMLVTKPRNLHYRYCPLQYRYGLQY